MADVLEGLYLCGLFFVGGCYAGEECRVGVRCASGSLVWGRLAGVGYHGCMVAVGELCCNIELVICILVFRRGGLGFSMEIEAPGLAGKIGMKIRFLGRA